jgi:hypothetical protein
VWAAMINELTRKYLNELQKNQQKIDDLNVNKESLDETSEEQFQVLTSEYHLEMGPIKLKVKKSKTFSGTKSLNKASLHSVQNKNMSDVQEMSSQAEKQSIRTHESPRQNTEEGLRVNRVDIII